MESTSIGIKFSPEETIYPIIRIGCMTEPISKSIKNRREQYCLSAEFRHVEKMIGNCFILVKRFLRHFLEIEVENVPIWNLDG